MKKLISFQYAVALLRLKLAVGSFSIVADRVGSRQEAVGSSIDSDRVRSLQYAGALLNSKFAIGSEHCCEKKPKYSLKNLTTNRTSFTTKMLNCLPHTASIRKVKQLPTFTTKMLNFLPHTASIRKVKQLPTFTTKMLNCLPHTASIRKVKQLPTFTTKMLTCLLPTASIRKVKQLPTFTTKMLNCLPHTASIRMVKQLPTFTTKMLTCLLSTASIRKVKQLPTFTTKMLTCLLPTVSIRKVKHCLLLICLLLCCQLTHAQLHPVQVNQNIIPPYNTKLNSYATTSAVKLRLYLTMTDVNISNRQIRLKLKIQGQGLNVQSVNFVQGAPLVFLNGGTTRQFTNIDLAPYFQLNNLIGISPQQYNKPMPDGRYKICWEVYDFLTGQRISNPQMGGCSNIFLLLNDPPFLNIPNRGDQLTNIQPTNIIFQWTPRHANASGVSYEFDLRELWDTQIDPQAGFLTSPPYHSETTYSTTLLYNISKPPLMPGRTYAWRVRAKSTTGLSENSVFKNNGYSEIFYFTYTDQCYPPTMPLAEPLNTGRVKISWKTHPDHNRYHVQYKRTDVADAEWFEIFSYNNQVQVAHLQEGVTYNFRVGGTCHALTDLNQAFTYSSVNQFTMPTKDETVSYSCGIVPEVEITNTNPLANIGVNETFTAGDFPVTIKQKQGGNGTFSGTGYIVVPYLADTKIAVEFKRIKINTDYQLYEGVVKTTYDATWGSVESVDKLLNGGDGQVNTSEVNFPIAEILVDPENEFILLVGEGGTPIVELSGGEDYVITDSGNPNADPPVPAKKYHVDEQGNVTELGPQAEGGTTTTENTTGVNSKGEAINITAKGVIVTFTQLPTASLPTAKLPTATLLTGFDAYNPSQPQTKDLYKKLGTDYYMPYKAVAKGKKDFIVANFNISNDSIQPKDIIFKTKDGVALEKVDSTDTSYTLKLRGTLSDADIETQALVKKGDKFQIAGAFLQYQIAIKEVEVVLVNTANADTDSITTKLKAIYQQAAVSINVSVINDFTATLNSLTPNGTIQSGESGFAAQYTEQQRSINKALKNHGNYKPNAYYLILTDKKPSTTGEKGLMPLGRQIGYIFTGICSTANCLPLNSAHELAHGAFQLKHPFSIHSYKYATGSTNWLLDYNNGAHLPYVHWKAIHNPKLRIGIFDGDQETEYKGGEIAQKILQELRCAYLNAKTEFKSEYLSKLPVRDRIILSGAYFEICLEYDGEHKVPLNETIKKIEGNYTKSSIWDYSPSKVVPKEFKYKYTIGGITIYTNNNNFDSYLKSTNESVSQDFNKVWSQIDISDGIDNNEFLKLKSIAACATKHLKASQRYNLLVKLIPPNNNIIESREDLILDLLETSLYRDDLDEFVDLLKEDAALFKILFSQIDDITYDFWNNENNKTRLLNTLYSIWSLSDENNIANHKYSAENPLIYYYNVGGTFIRTFSIEQEDFRFKNNNTICSRKYIDDKGFTADKCYNVFQPIRVIYDEGETIKLPSKDVPAFYLMGVHNLENLKARMTSANLSLDLALTLSAVGNFSKLKELPKAYRVAKIVISGVEIASSVVDLVLTYTEACSGDSEFCTKLKAYNFWLQIATLSSDIVVSKMAKKAANDVLQVADETLPSEIRRHLDVVVGGVDDLVKTGGSLLTKLDNALFSVLKGNVNQLDDVLKPQFLDDFANASDNILKKLQDENLFDVWKNDIRSNIIDELTDYLSKRNLRNDYVSAVETIGDRVAELRNLGKTDIEIAQEVFELRRQTTINFKNVTPDDMLPWIFEFNDIRYTQKGLGDKWGLTWDGVVTKATKNGVTDYNRIINGASIPLGDKQALGKALFDVVGNKTLSTLEKYRMMNLIY